MFERFNLTDAADRLVGTWSGGMRRKLDVAMGLINHPRVLFLDEPTTGLDPEARAELWAEVASLSRDGGLAILLTTHYLEEADHLADHLAIVDHGRIVAGGTPEALKAELHGDAIHIVLEGPAGGQIAASVLARIDGLASPDRRRRPRDGSRRPRRVPRPVGPVGARGCRRRRRDRDRRPALARRRLSQPHRPVVPPGDPGARPMTAVAQTMYQSERHLRAFVRQPWFVLMAIIQPVIWLLLFGALFQNVTLIPGFATGGSYLDYLVPGVLVMTALFSCGWSGMSIIEDLDRSIVDRFLVTPVHRSAIIGGLTIYQLVSLVIQAAIIGGLALLLGAHFEGGLLGYAALTLCAMLVGAAVASFSDAMALTLRQRESVIGINTLMTLPLTFLSAAFIPLALAPEWIQTVAHYNPVNWAVEAGREALTATPDWSFVVPRIVGLFVLAVLATGWATRTFRSYQRSI